MSQYEKNTMGWWLQKSLPESLVDRAIEESVRQKNKDNAVFTCINAGTALNAAFLWRSSKEGHDFWNEIYECLLEDKFYVPKKWFVLYSNVEEFKEIASFHKKGWPYGHKGGYYTELNKNYNNWVTCDSHHSEYMNYYKNLPDQGYIQLTIDEWREHICKNNNQQDMKEEKMFTVTRQQIKTLHDAAGMGCSWRTTLKDIATAIPWHEDSTTIKESMVINMFRDANNTQKLILREVFLAHQEEKPFTAADLEIGEMMRILEEPYSGKVVLKTYGFIVDLDNPNNTWSADCSIKGEKLPSGYQVTITAK